MKLLKDRDWQGRLKENVIQIYAVYKKLLSNKMIKPGWRKIWEKMYIIQILTQESMSDYTNII